MSKKEKVKAKAKDCPVCMNYFTPVIRQPIQCSFCPHSTCRQCTSHYLLTTLNDPHCMECKREWNREFIDTKLTQTFRKGPLKLHRRRVLIDRERGRLPAMQVFVEAQSTITRNAEQISKLKSERKQLKIQRNQVQVQYGPEGIDALSKRLEPIQKALAEKKVQIRVLDRQLWTARSVLTGQEKPAVRQFIMKCPAEGCRGFLSSAWKCGTCEKFFCHDCHAQKKDMKDEEHVCNEDAKATAAMIRQETKACPKCGIRISKIDGCDQMWCTGCHTTFSWNTGQILLNTVVHNPHYYEYLRKTNGAVPREAGDVPCGGLPQIMLFHRAIYDNPHLTPDMKYKITGIHRNIQDILHVRIPQFPLRANANINRDIDISYLMNQMTEEEWGTKLEQAETKSERKREVGLILQTLVHIASEKLTMILNERNLMERSKIVSHAMKELEEVRDYINKSLIQKGLQMGMVVPQVNMMLGFEWASREQLKEEKKKKNTIVYPGSTPAEEVEVEVEEEEEDPPEENPQPTDVKQEILEEEKEADVILVELDGEILEMTRKQVEDMGVKI